MGHVFTGAEAATISAHQVRLLDGRLFTAAHVVDARGPIVSEDDRSGFQKFVGLELELASELEHEVVIRRIEFFVRRIELDQLQVRSLAQGSEESRVDRRESSDRRGVVGWIVGSLDGDRELVAVRGCLGRARLVRFRAKLRFTNVRFKSIVVPHLGGWAARAWL